MTDFVTFLVLATATIGFFGWTGRLLKQYQGAIAVTATAAIPASAAP